MIQEFIQFIIDRANAGKLNQDAEQIGKDAGQAAAKGAQKTAPGIADAFSKAMTNARQAVNKITDGIQNRFDSLFNAVKAGWEKAFPISFAIALERVMEKLAAFAKQMVVDLAQAAANTQRIGIEFDTIFGEFADQAEKTARSFAGLMGTSVNEMKDFLISVQGVAIGLGMGRQQATNFSSDMVKLAADIARFKGIEFERALHAIQGGLVGITRPLHTLGIMLYEDTIKQQAMAETGKRNADELTEQEKALAAYHAMLRLTAPMTGSATRLQGTLNNLWSQSISVFKDARDTVGKELIPILSGLAGWVKENGFAITNFLIGAFRTLSFVIIELIEPLRIVGDVAIATFYGWASGVDLVIAGIAKLISLIPGLKVMEGVAQDFFEQGAKNAEAAQKALKDMGPAIADMMKAVGVLTGLGGPEDQRHPPGTLSGPAPRRDKSLDADHLKKELKAIHDGVQMAETRAEAFRKATELEARLNEELKKGNLTFEERVRYHEALIALHNTIFTQYDKEIAIYVELEKHDDTRANAMQNLLRLRAELMMLTTKDDEAEAQRAKRLHDVNKAIADARVEGVKKQLDEVAGMEKSGQKLMDIYEIRKKLNELAKTAKTAEDLEAINKLKKASLHELDHFTLPELAAGVFEAGTQSVEKFGQALKMLAQDSRTVSRVLMALGKGAGKQLLLELKDLAVGKAIENLAWALEDTGLAIMGDAAAGEAALSHFASAAEWGLLAGGLNNMGVNRGGEGSSSVGGGASGRVGGSTSDQTDTLPQTTYIFIDPLDPDNARAQDVVGSILMQAQETGRVIIRRTNEAPAAMRRG